MRYKRCKLCGCIIYDDFNDSGVCEVCEDDMNDSNKEVIEGSLQEILDEGFDACKVCNPEGV